MLRTRFSCQWELWLHVHGSSLLLLVPRFQAPDKAPLYAAVSALLVWISHPIKFVLTVDSSLSSIVHIYAVF